MIINIKIILFSLCVTIFSSTMFGQSDQVIEQIEDAFDEYGSAFKKTQQGIYYINQSLSKSTISDAQYDAISAESEISSAKSKAGYAEDEASDAESAAESIHCEYVADYAGDAEDYFYSAKRSLSNALNELSSASYEDDPDSLINYMNNAKDYANEALSKLNKGVDELNRAMQSLKNCAGATVESGGRSISCDDFEEFIIDNGYRKDNLSSYTLDSDWLTEITAYDYDSKIYIIAKIKVKNSYSSKSYIFCDIPTRNWSNFKYGGYGENKTYGERFHDYIIKFVCNCE